MRWICFILYTTLLSGCYTMVDQRYVEYGNKKYKIAIETSGDGSDFQFADNIKLTRSQIAKLANTPDPSNASESVDVVMIASKVVDMRGLFEANDASTSLIASLTDIAKKRLSANPAIAPIAQDKVNEAVTTAKKQAEVVVKADNVATAANVIGATSIATQATKVLNDVSNAPLNADVTTHIQQIESLNNSLQQITKVPQ